MAGRVVILFLIFILLSCREGQKETKEVPGQPIALKDITLTFNGKPFAGWEVTNFGPQGPVYISGNDIILGMGDGCTGIT
jgi:hypothetical protein